MKIVDKILKIKSTAIFLKKTNKFRNLEEILVKNSEKYE